MFKTRYDFFKRIYKDYVLVFLINGYYYIFYKDKIIISYFKDKAIFDKLNEIHINYIILDNTEIIDRVEFVDNRYREMLKKTLVLEIVNSQLIKIYNYKKIKTDK